MRFLAFLLLAAGVSVFPAHAKPNFFLSSGNGEFPVTTPSGVLDALVASMDPGEWKLIPGSDMAAVLVTTAERDAINNAALIANPGLTLANVNFWGFGPQKILQAWNSAAYDPVGRRWFFMGGGHNDYGGNEVYEYDFDTLTWTRLTEPEALTVPSVNAPGFYVPAVGPVSPHTYDSLVWNPDTETMWMYGNGLGFKYTGPPLYPDLNAIWEFDPDTGVWTSYPVGQTAQFGAAVYLPLHQKTFAEGSMSSSVHPGYLYDNDGTETPIGGGGNIRSGGDNGNAFRVPDSASPAIAGKLFIAHLEYGLGQITEFTLNVAAATTTKVTTQVPITGFDVRQAGYAFNPDDELFYVWGGTRAVYTFDPATYTWGTLDNVASPLAPTSGVGVDGVNRIMDKWIYLEPEGVFAGLHDPIDNGIWLWKPPAP